MNQYILIFRGQKGDDHSEEALKERLQVHVNWIEKLGDQHVDSQRLDNHGAHVISISEVETEGDFMGIREVILGFTIILAKDMDEAIFLAKTCTLLTYYEIIVRPVVV